MQLSANLNTCDTVQIVWWCCARVLLRITNSTDDDKAGTVNILHKGTVM